MQPHNTSFCVLWILLATSCVTHAFFQHQCTQDRLCDIQSYCFRPNGVEAGQCTQCWACCMFPERFGACPTKCGCSAPGYTCQEDADCGWGQFCKTENTIATCATCVDTLQNTTACVNRPLNTVATMRDVRKQAFMDFYAYYVVGQSETWITRNALVDWLDGQVLTSEAVYARINMSLPSQSPVLYFDIADALYDLTIENRMCETNSSVTLPNCPCASSTTADHLKCPSGYVCSKSAYIGVSSMLYEDPWMHTLKAICVSCRPGDYCPPGSILQDFTYIQFEKLRCPSGYYCPQPAEKLPCPNGTFCDRGFTTPLSCNYTHLMETQGIVPKRPDTVLERLFIYDDPYTGNICLDQATSPGQSCPEKYYCPSSTEQYHCPEGYYCQAQSVNPIKCPPLSRCPEGSAEPDPIVIPYIFGGLVVGCILLIYVIRGRFNAGTKSTGTARVTTTAQSLRMTYTIPTKTTSIKPLYNAFFSTFANLRQSEEPPLSLIRPLEKLDLVRVSAPWLHMNSASFSPCKLNIIIGGSGCGKSTFLDLLRGSIPNGKLTGLVEMKIQGEQEISMDLGKIHRHTQWSAFDKMKKIRGYVPQDDIVYGDLTVRENLLYSAKLKLGETISPHIDQVVDYVLDRLGLTSLAHQVVGTVERRGISGGQRKRVNIGMEVATLPSLLILDEPTSGLDAHGCQSLIEFCRCLTDMNITIVGVVHQPRYTSFIMFDQVTLLSKFGTIYEGPPATSLLYFNQGLNCPIDKNENPADILMDIISGGQGVSPQELVDMWRTAGTSWNDRAMDTYPLGRDILNFDVSFDARVREILRGMFQGQTALTWMDIKHFLSDLFIQAHEVDVREFVRIYGKDGRITVQEFTRVIQERCAEAFLSTRYDNVIERIALFKMLPQSIRHTEQDSARHIFLAYKFARRLLQKLKGHVVPAISTTEIAIRNKTLLEQELLLASMTCKAIYETERRRVSAGNTFAFQPEQPQQSIKHPRLHGCFNTFLKCVQHVGVILIRKLLMIWRSPWPIQLMIPMIAAFIIGKIHGYGVPLVDFPNNVVAAMVCMGVLSMITHVRTFTLDKVVIRRETDGPISMLPFYIAYNITDCLWIFLIPVMFTIPYYYLTYPHGEYVNFLGVAVMVCWWTSGCAYIISAFPLAMHWVNLIAVFVSVIFGAFLQGLNPNIYESTGSFQGFLIHLSYNRWAMEILTLKEYAVLETTRINTVWSAINTLGLCGLDGTMFSDIDPQQPSFAKLHRIYNTVGQDIDTVCKSYMTHAYLWLFGYGCIFRIIAIVLLTYTTHPIWIRFQWFLGDCVCQLGFFVSQILHRSLKKLKVT